MFYGIAEQGNPFMPTLPTASLGSWTLRLEETSTTNQIQEQKEGLTYELQVR